MNEFKDMKQIGQLLRERREARNLSVENVHIRTRVPVKYLAALEDGNVSQFPAEVYLTGSLRHYAEFLGLDASSLVEQYRASVRPAEEEQRQPPESDRSTSRAFLYAVVAVALIVTALAVYGIRSVIVQPEPPAPVADAGDVRQEVAPSTAPVQSPATAPAPPPAASPGPAATERLRLKVETNDESWLRVIADGRKAFEGMVGPGRSMAWTAANRFRVKVGYVPGVTVRLNGRVMDLASGARNDVNEVVLTAGDAER